MAPDATCKTSFVIVIAFLLGMVRTTSVDLIQNWKPDFGWEITCSWKLYANDSLQSVNLSKNRQQFMIFRPQNHPNKNLSKKQSWYLVENVMIVECIEDDTSGTTGKCVVTLEPQMPPKKDFTFGCQVSGERPFFRMDEKEIFVEAFVAPNDTDMRVTKHESGSVTVNCTASGLPAPVITWTVEGQKVPHTFHSVPVWNVTSKLFEVWSSFDPQPDDLNKLECTPELYKDRNVIKGPSAMYNGATKCKITLGTSFLLALAASALLRVSISSKVL